jgi:tight adherence protein B
MAVLIGLIGLYLFYASVKESPTYELRKRLRTLALEGRTGLPEDIRLEILVEMTPLDKFLYKFTVIRKLHESLDKAGMKMDVKMFLLIFLAIVVAAFVIGALLQKGILIALAFVLIAIIGIFIFLHFKKRQRIIKFSDQFANALDMMSRSLKAGHSLAAAIQMIGNEMAEPVAGLFRSVYEEQTYGLSLSDAFANMIRRMDTPDVRFFVTAVSIYREIGGNLSEILERLAHTIRERIKIKRQVRVYTAQARLSGYILAVLPIFVFLFFYLMAEDYMMELFSIRAGYFLVIGAVVLQVIGFFVIRRIMDIRI